jgi:hypothetical protein
MAKESDNNKPITRRGILPILGSTFLLPFIGFTQSNSESEITTDDEAYETLLKPDGTTVKVKKSTLKKSNVVKKNISNKAFLTWLDKKL